MKLQLEIGDRLRTVEVRRQGTAYVVTLDGQPRLVEAARTADGALSLIVRDNVDGAPRSVEARVELAVGNGSLNVHIDGYSVAVHVHNGLATPFGSLRARRSATANDAEVAAAQRITAPMPGKVVRVPVKQGDMVKPRQVVVVVEAMKMENELRATREGTVVDLLVTQGQSVEAGALLAVVADSDRDQGNVSSGS